MKRNYLLLAIFFLLNTSIFASENKSPQKVYIGIYLMNLYDMDMNDHSFYADFYLWLRWKGDVDVTQLEFVNAVEKWGLTITDLDESIKVIDDGYNYKSYRIESRFFHPFELERFPLDKHALNIKIENSQLTKDSLIFVPDKNNTGILQALKIPGWNIKEYKFFSTPHQYQSNFGIPSKPQETYSQANFQILINRPINYFLLKLMLPLAVVLLTSLGALWINPTYVDARISLPIGGLLTTVFLQQAYSYSLPDVGYMVLLDKIYLAAYIVIGLVMARVIVASNYIAKQSNTLAFEEVQKQEARIVLLMIVSFLLATSVLILL